MLKVGLLNMRRPAQLAGIAALAAAALGLLALSLLFGPAELGWQRVLAALLGEDDPFARTVLLELRLPRALAAFSVGSVLALAGALLQAVFRNPLADPFVLGVSGGAAIGGLLAMLLGASVMILRLSALGGAAAAVLVVFALGRGGDNARLLLTGVVLASGCGALVTVLLALADVGQLRGMVFWLSGDLGFAPEPLLSLLAGAAGLCGALLLARPLNVIASGELRARSVGLDVDAARWTALLASAALTSVAVVAAGTIGFVGLIAPHAVRLAFRTTDHRIVAPAAALAGGAILIAADLIARSAAAPRQLPVGAVMALLGTPLFLLLLRRGVQSRPGGL
jgi:iron complex transport system permease protein